MRSRALQMFSDREMFGLESANAALRLISALGTFMSPILPRRDGATCRFCKRSVDEIAM